MVGTTGLSLAHDKKIQSIYNRRPIVLKATQPGGKKGGGGATKKRVSTGRMDDSKCSNTSKEGLSVQTLVKVSTLSWVASSAH